MDVKKCFFLLAISIVLAGCKIHTIPTQVLVPIVAAGIDTASVHGYDLSVSRRGISEVSLFGVALDNYLILWIQYENLSDSAIDFEPWRVSAIPRVVWGPDGHIKHLSGRSRTNDPYEIGLTRVDARRVEGLNRRLADVYRALRGAAPPGDPRMKLLRDEWRKYGGEYQSVDQMLLKATRYVGARGSVDGYVMFQRSIADQYSISVPIAGDTHQFQMATKPRLDEIMDMRGIKRNITEFLRKNGLGRLIP